MQNKLLVTSAPHIRSDMTISKVMFDVIISLLPVCLFGIYMYGFLSIRVIFTCVLVCVLTEAIAQKMMKRAVTIKDLSAVVTGLLLALTLPPKLPIWMAAIGSAFAIGIGKQAFGGLGYNPFNPALVGRAFLQISWPKEMSSWITPFEHLTTATPLNIVKYGLGGEIPAKFTLLIGNYAGTIGETSTVLLIAGGLYLLIRRQIQLYTPISYIFTVAFFCVIFGADVFFHILTGGLILGAFYMATDPVTTPVFFKGKIIFGIGCGIITSLIRLKGAFPEGVCFSILIMNMFTPFIDRYIMPKRFGT